MKNLNNLGVSYIERFRGFVLVKVGKNSCYAKTDRIFCKISCNLHNKVLFSE